MYGSIFFNCWGALIGFTIAFVMKIIEPFAMPVPTILGSLVWAIVAFFAMFIVRYFIGYIMYTPEEIVYDEELMLPVQELQEKQPNLPNRQTSTVEFSDENSEEVAQVVRTMLHKEEQLA